MRSSLLVVPALLLVLVGCAPATPTPTAAPPVETPSATPTPAAPTFDDDVLLVIAATVTDEGGAQLRVEMQVRKATSWDDAAHRDRPELMTTTCDGSLEDSVYSDQLWSFAAVDVTATTTAASTGTWPVTDDGKRIWLDPKSGFVPLASAGDVVTDDDVDQATPFCARDRYLNGPGSGTVVVGLAGDNADAGAAGNFTRWANHSYGLTTKWVEEQTPADTGLTVSDCSITVTPAGAELNGTAAWREDRVDDSDCLSISTAPED